MTQPVYEKLTDALKMRGGAAPAIKCPEFYAIIEELFTPEEAELASKMPLGLVSAADMAKETGGDPKVAGELLESMANKGLLLSFVRDDALHYDLLQLVPGIFEMQFMTGEVSERAKRLAYLFEDYFNAMQKLPRSGASGVFPTFPWARVVTVEQEIPGEVEVHPYDMVSQYIENAPYITVATCYCRHHGELVGRPCDKPKNNCLGFGPGAKANADRGFARLISKEEAREILKRAEEAGLVHLSSNTGKYIDFICNCCICHCGILQSVKNAASPSMAASSSFVISLEKGDCSGCGDCVEICPMDALAMEDDVAALDSDRCIGCGLCISRCPTGALKLEPREGAPVPPRDRGSLGAALMSSMQPNT
jgi:formate hydrogenlyase subunit 6/NADH:ubiquinone oxidoreductase subunit I